MLYIVHGNIVVVIIYALANVSSFRRVRTRRIIISESNEPSNGPPLPPRAPGVLHVGRIHIFFSIENYHNRSVPGTLKGRVEQEKFVKGTTKTKIPEITRTQIPKIAKNL